MSRVLRGSRPIVYLLLLFSLLLLFTGCAGRGSAPKAGLKVTVRAEGVYSVSCSTENHTEVGQNADNSALTPDSSLYFSPYQGETLYTIRVLNTVGKPLATAQLAGDFSRELLELTVTEDLEFVYE